MSSACRLQALHLNTVFQQDEVPAATAPREGPTLRRSAKPSACLRARPSPRSTGRRYVEQFDTLLGALTVREMLLYTAELKRSMHEPFADKAAAVDAVLDQLGLVTCAGVNIGSKARAP